MVVENAGSGVGQRIRPRLAIRGRGHPVHRGETADEVDVGHVEPPEAEVVEVDPVGGPCVTGR